MKTIYIYFISRTPFPAYPLKMFILYIYFLIELYFSELRIVDEICVSFCNTFVAPLAFVCIPLCESMPDLIYSIGKGNPAGIKNAICNQVPWTNPLYPFCHLWSVEYRLKSYYKCIFKYFCVIRCCNTLRLCNKFRFYLDNQLNWEFSY